MNIDHKAEVRRQVTADLAPRISAVVGPEDPGGRDRAVHPVRVAWIHEDGVQAQAAGARRPAGRRLVGPKAGQLAPRLGTVARLEDGGVFDARVDRVRVTQRWFEVPDALELVGMWRTVVPGVRADRALVHELVAGDLPGLAAVVRALHHLAEPAAGLGGVETIRVGR